MPRTTWLTILIMYIYIQNKTMVRLEPPNMTSRDDFVQYAPVPSHPLQHQNVVVLPLYYRSSYRRCRRLLSRLCLLLIAVLLLCAVIFFLYPSDPALKVARVHLNRVRVNSSPRLTLDLSFSLVVNVRNRDFFALDYDSLMVYVGYRGRELGFVRSGGGRIRARGSSYVNATLDLDALEIIHDVFYLLADLAKGVIPFDTTTEVIGYIGLFSFKIPLKAKVSCQVYVNTNDQAVVRQDCYPE